MNGVTIQHTDYDLPDYEARRTIYAGSVALNKTDDPAQSISDTIADISLTPDKLYMIITSIPSEIRIESLKGEVGNQMIGPMDLGGTQLSISADGVLTVRNNIMIGKRPGPCLDMIYIEITEVEKTSGEGGGSGGTTKVYVPHIDERKILTFTLEDGTGKVPDPVDLNPNDEWHDIEGSEIFSDYVWDEIGG